MQFFGEIAQGAKEVVLVEQKVNEAYELIEFCKKNHRELNTKEYLRFIEFNISIANSKNKSLISRHYGLILDQVIRTQHLNGRPEHGLYLGLQRHFRGHCIKNGINPSDMIQQSSSYAAPAA